MKARTAHDSLHLVLGIALLILGIYARWGDWLDIWNIAMRDPEASHVMLAPIVVVALVWVRRERLRRIKLQTSWLGPIIVLLGCSVCYFGDGHGYQSLRHVGAVSTAVGCVVTMLGREVLFAFAPAFAALAFLIPMPPTFRQRISLPLEGINAYITQDILSVFGIPITKSGNQLFLNGKAVSIVEACNGLRMFFTISMVSYLVAFYVPLRFYVRALVVGLSPASAVICNVVRLVPTIWVMGNMSEEAGHTFHDISAWVMLPIALGMLFVIVWALRWAMVPVSPFTLARD